MTVQLIDVPTGFCLWSERYDRELKDVFDIQDDIARRITEALVLTLSVQEQHALRRPAARDVAAYDYYLRGRQLYHRYNRHAAAEARELFARAAQIDTAFASAFAGMSDCHAYLYIHGGRDQRQLDAALDAGRTALRLDPSLAEVHTSLATALSLEGRRDEQSNPSHYNGEYP